MSRTYFGLLGAPGKSFLALRGPCTQNGIYVGPKVLMIGTTLRPKYILLLTIEILHYLKDPKLWEIWYIPH